MMTTCVVPIEPASMTDPPEPCTEEALPGEEVCAGHLLDIEPDPDAAYDRYRDELMGIY